MWVQLLGHQWIFRELRASRGPSPGPEAEHPGRGRLTRCVGMGGAGRAAGGQQAPGRGDGSTPPKERPPGSPRPRRPRTWFGYAEARAAPAQGCAQPAPSLPPQRAVPARLAAADAVLLPRAGLSLHLVYKRRGQPGSLPRAPPRLQARSPAGFPLRLPPTHTQGRAVPAGLGLWRVETPRGPSPPPEPAHRRRSGSRSSSTREPSSRAGCTCCSRSGHTRCSRSWCRRAVRGSLGKQGPQGPRSVPPSSLLTPGRGLLGRAPAPHQALTSCRPQLSLHLQSPEAHKRPFSSALPRCLGFHHWNRLLLVNHT